MTTYVDLLLDASTGDLSITNGDFELTPDSGSSLRQRLQIRFSTWKGEWVYNQAFGTPYRQRLLAAGSTKEMADAEYLTQIYLEDDVTSVKGITSTYDSATRTYKLTNAEVYVDNESLDLSFVYPTMTEYSYTYPTPVVRDDTTFNVCELDQDFVASSNSLYELLNFDLPITGDSTWWKLW